MVSGMAAARQCSRSCDQLCGRYGRQEMRNLVLEVDAAGKMSGSGDDCVGPFTITGTVSAEVRLVKQYLGRHALLYVGTNSGEGIFGTWKIPGVPMIPGLTSGRFALFPKRESSAGCAQIRELEPVGCR